MERPRVESIRGVIRRRILANFRVDPEVAQRQLPAPFRPKLHRGHAIGGVCLIRLEHVRPAAIPLPLGVASENAAHRFAVEWTDETGAIREGVYVPRRDTSSALNRLAGGLFFPGEYHGARFCVQAVAAAPAGRPASDLGLRTGPTRNAGRRAAPRPRRPGARRRRAAGD